MDFFLGWITPEETSPAEFTLNGLTTGSGDTASTSETPSPWSKTEGIPLTAEGLPVQPPTLETDSERDQRFTDALAALNFPGRKEPADKKLIHDTLESYRDVLRGMPSGYLPPHRDNVDHRIPIPDPHATPPYL